MIAKWLIVLAYLFSQYKLIAAPLSESAAVQELRLSVDRLHYQYNSHTVDLNLIQERTQQLEASIASLKKELKTGSSENKKIAHLEKAQEALASDLRLLKSHLNEANTTMAALQTQLNKVDKQLSGDINTLKNSIQTVIALLQGEPKTYTVKSGDSLGQIALEHKTDIKTLKKLNNLSSDTIFSGQKITLP